MNETLKEQLNLPIIGGEIIAYFKSREKSYFKLFDGCSSLIWEIDSYESLLAEILQYIVDEELKLNEHSKRHMKAIKCLEKVNKREYSYELVSELLEFISEVNIDSFVKSSTNIKGNLHKSILDSEKFLRKLWIRLRGIRTVFGDNESIVIKMLDGFDFSYYCILDRVFKNQPQKLYYSDWFLNVRFNGPDRRYLNGSIDIASNDFAGVLTDLEVAMQKMKSLKEVEFNGVFTKIIRGYKPKLEIVARNREIRLNFWVSSKNYDYSQTIDISNLEIIISKLKQVKERGEKLTSTLEVLSF